VADGKQCTALGINAECTAHFAQVGNGVYAQCGQAGYSQCVTTGPFCSYQKKPCVSKLGAVVEKAGRKWVKVVKIEKRQQ